MSAQFRPQSAAANRRSASWRYRLPAILTACALLAQGCAATPPQPFQGADASNPDVRVPPVAYRPVLGTYSSQRPVEPASWGERNDQGAPIQKKDGQ
jgi:hypothetical protein